MDSLFGFYMKNWFKRAYFEVSTTSEKFHYISRDLHLVNLDHCVDLANKFCEDFFFEKRNALEKH